MKPIMESLEAIKTLLEIIVIFITFPQYAPMLAVIVALGVVYDLLKDENETEDEPATNESEATDQCPISQEPRSTENLPEAKP